MYNTLAVLWEKSKMVYFASSIIKSVIVYLASLSRFPMKLICYIAFGSLSSACCLLKSISIILKYILIIAII